MCTSHFFRFHSPKHAQQSGQQGFTLLEIMVVILIMGLMVSLVSVIVQPDERNQLDVETQRLGRLLELLAAKARFSGTTLAWSAESGAYRFMQHSDDSGWLAVNEDDALRPRQLPAGMFISSLLVENTPAYEDMRVEFPAYGQTTAFTIVLTYGDASSQVTGSPIGMVSVTSASKTNMPTRLDKEQP